MLLPFSVSDTRDASLLALSPKFTGTSDLKGDLAQPHCCSLQASGHKDQEARSLRPPALITSCAQQSLQRPRDATRFQP